MLGIFQRILILKRDRRLIVLPLPICCTINVPIPVSENAVMIPAAETTYL